MLSWLRRTFAPTHPPTPQLVRPDVFDQLAVLDRKVAKLESERLELLTEWVKTRDQVIRYMKRAGAIRAREDGTDPETGDDGDERELDLLAARIRGINGSR